MILIFISIIKARIEK